MHEVLQEENMRRSIERALTTNNQGELAPFGDIA
jgi:hypothetical protein